MFHLQQKSFLKLLDLIVKRTNVAAVVKIMDA